MPARRLLMRKIREVLRLKYERGLSHRAIAQACAIGVGTVTLYLQRTSQLGLRWPLPAELDDAALEARLFHRPVPVRERVRPDCPYIYRELKRDGVTLQLLWEEYRGDASRRRPPTTLGIRVCITAGWPGKQSAADREAASRASPRRLREAPSKAQR